MYNLMISEIFRVKKQPNSKSVVDNKKTLNKQLSSFEKCLDLDDDSSLENLRYYNGLFDPESSSIYQSVRNLYSLSHR